MKFFIDTANLEEIRQAKELGILDGVTTNPSLMAKEGITGYNNIMRHYAKICKLVGGDVSAEVISTDYKGMVEEGLRLRDISDHIVVKVPITKDGVRAISTFSDKEIPTNCTLVFSLGQAILAARAGATYLSPFIGRLDDINWDGIELIREISDLYSMQGIDTEILAASIRNAKHITDAFAAGADVVTSPLDAIVGLIRHPLTDIGLEKFISDHIKAHKAELKNPN